MSSTHPQSAGGWKFAREYAARLAHAAGASSARTGKPQQAKIARQAKSPPGDCEIEMEFYYTV